MYKNLDRLDDSAFDNPEKRKDYIELLKASISLLGISATIAAGIGLAINYNSAEKDRNINLDKLATEKLAKSVEQLSSDNLFVKVSGIYSLESVADSDKNKKIVAAILDSFIIKKSFDKEECPNRDSSPKDNNYKQVGKQKKDVIELDLQSSLIVFSKINPISDGSKDTKHNRSCLNFSGMQLKDLSLGANNFEKSKFKGTHFSGSRMDSSSFGDSIIIDSDFSNARMNNTNFVSVESQNYVSTFNSTELKKSNFTGSHLNQVTFIKASLEKAIFENAELMDTKFNGAKLNEVNFKGANLKGAILLNANIKQAIFIDSIMTDEQILSACYWDEAHYKANTNDNKNYIETLRKKSKQENKSKNCDSTESTMVNSNLNPY
jgi:uncharacterized protein YjbI with pentapeptide repeats